MGDIRDVAMDAVARISTLVRELQDGNPGSNLAFCTSLGTVLEGVRRWLEMPSSGSGSEQDIWKLLRRLEQLAEWPASIRAIAYDGDRVKCAKSFPGLYKLQKNRLRSKENIRQLSISSKKRAVDARWKIQHSLEKFSDLIAGTTTISETTQLLEDERRSGETLQNEPDDIHPYIQVLHASLLPYRVCRLDSEPRPILANLRLNHEEIGDQGVSFRLLFLDHPHDILDTKTNRSQWQDARICVYRRRAAHFAGEEATYNEASPQPLRQIEANQFCEVISNHVPSLQLVARDGSLVQEDWTPPTKWYSLRNPGVSLANLLEAKKLHPKMRLLLSYYLAKATWQFYDTDWMIRAWTKDNIYFMPQHPTDLPAGIFVNDPFFSSGFEEHSGLTTETAYQSHRFPKLLALGVMLIEVELGTKIEDYFESEWLDRDGNPTRTTYHFAAMKAFNTQELWKKRHTFCFIRESIKTCLFPEPFKRHLNDPAGQRGELYKLIVARLGARYGDAWADPENSEIDPIQIDDPSKTVLLQGSRGQTGHMMSQDLDDLRDQPRGMSMSRCIAIDPIQQDCDYSPKIRVIPGNEGTKPRNDVGSVADAEYTFTSDDWFSELRRLSSTLRIKERGRDAESRPTRIGVLDTGISTDFSDSRSIKEYKDFVGNDNETYTDSTDHGTLIFRLIQHIYGAADMYVGRVWEDATMTDQTPSLMVKAIDHAILKWNVDVIVIASGFQSQYEDIHKAIERAKGAHKLVFAAASNYGNLSHIAFPGCLYRSGLLFCMFSTNAEARGFPHFNPTAVSAAIDSFAVLGQNIALPNLERSISGTSYSTAIGASLAGMLLDFSRHPDIRERMRHKQHLGRVEGMAAVFSRMSRSGLDNGYRCIVPWALIPSDCGEDVGRNIVRERICDIISEALGNIW